MKKIVYKTEIGISIITPTRNIESCMKDIPSGVEYKIIDDLELPKDRIFRNAWNYDLKEDIPKAKEIWKEKLRTERQPLLEALDIIVMRLLEKGLDPSEIVDQKQILRDITDKVDLANTIEEIKQVVIKEIEDIKLKYPKED